MHSQHVLHHRVKDVFGGVGHEDVAIEVGVAHQARQCSAMIEVEMRNECDIDVFQALVVHHGQAGHACSTTSV